MKKTQRGVALLMVLMALALLTGGLSWLAVQGREEIERTRLLQQRVQARAVDSAVRAFAVQAMRDPRWRESPLYWQAIRGLPLPYRFEGGEARLLLRDQRTCFNLNALAGGDSQRARRQLNLLLGGDMASDRLTQQVADWVDNDQQTNLLGAESAEYLRHGSTWLAANQLLHETSELNLLPPTDPQRYLRHPQLCALPDTGAWQLNANAVTLNDLPLLEALYEGELPSSLLTRLISARPAEGYRDSAQLRQSLGALDDATYTRLTEGLVLSSDHFLLGIEVRLDDTLYRTTHQVEVRGVSKWYSRVPAQQVLFRGRQPAPWWSAESSASELMP